MPENEIKEVSPPQPVSQPVKSLVGKLAEAFANVGGLAKQGTNSAQGYKYLKAADVAKAVRMELFTRGVIMTSNVSSSQWSEFTTNKGSRMTVCRLTVAFTFHDSDSNEVISFSGVGEAFDTGDKACYKATTGALKYALRTAGLIPDEKDDPEADEKVDREMAEDAVAAVEKKHLGEFSEREAKQPPAEVSQPKERKAEGWVVLTKITKAKTKAGAEFWKLDVVDINQKASQVSAFDKKLMTPELWNAGGKDLKIKISSSIKGDKTYYNLEAVYQIGSQEIVKAPAQTADWQPTDEEDPFLTDSINQS